MKGRIVGGLMCSVAGKTRAVAVLLLDAPTIHCWRCLTQIYPSDLRYAIGDDPAFPIVAVGPCCLTAEDSAARETP